MRPLTTQRALGAWERGQRHDALGRALALLSAALPGVSWDELAELPVGQRDALLLRLRQVSFGSEMRGAARCPGCGAGLEFGLDLRTYDIMGQLEAKRRAPERFSADGYKVLFRLPNSHDLRTVTEYCLEPAGGRQLLLDRCVLEARHRGRPVRPRELPEKVIGKLAAHMEEIDPLAELPLAIDCARCGHKWVVFLDIGMLMWDEISAMAQRLLREIHLLAKAYGWSEEEILKLTAARRRYYIEQVRPSSEGETSRSGW